MGCAWARLGVQGGSVWLGTGAGLATGGGGGQGLTYVTAPCLRPPQDCSISTGECSATEEWPGLWEFPLYIAQEDNGTVLGSMDTPVRVGAAGGVLWVQPQ